MNDAKIDLITGNIVVNGVSIAPLTLDEFLRITIQHNIKFKKNIPNEGWSNFGLGVTINNQDFGLNISYSKNELYSTWFSWAGGISEKKGYDTTEKELIADKNSLSKFLTKIIGKEPEEKEYNHNIFLFEWGNISVAASLQSAMVSMGVTWHRD